MVSGRNLKRVHFINRTLLGRQRKVVDMGTEDRNEYVDIGEDELLVQSKYMTETIEERNDLIRACAKLYKEAGGSVPALRVSAHQKLVEWPLRSPMPAQFTTLDAAQPWVLYWTANALTLTGSDLVDQEMQQRLVKKLEALFTSLGYAGGLHQLPNIACTYAAIETFVLCDSSPDAWSRINRVALYQFLLRLKEPEGGFRTVCPVGEVDARAMYTVLSVASLLQILTPDLAKGCADFLLGCQTYEGGFGACPGGDEAHGGYTFCAVAALAIIGALDRADTRALLDWCSARQKNEERGLSGRTNKLVDSCYSFWVGGTAAILEAYGYGECIDKDAMASYLLTCCQDTYGMRDKPGKPADFYHTNYALLGLAVTQYNFAAGETPADIECTPIGTPDICPINPVYGLPAKNVRSFVAHFRQA
ncbi:ADR275Wp [Eremothecium gossypii ATCC 10895]|uniref:Protein farnesyltransferase subunit beta n=1 Tax=Eremothecium gossypii (strain ATCC 10895 / CBS 109.51 / FGSC 9923 / NRRL Y-1056) TaxID=284811 RepID=Q759K2_EREGS|nr:ADR275Wp [Eremothecium gossypii ATCC 10895]AAS52195.1 ADR275Wp [Eremothecium gossypii ATCC 10895]AEY96494.1 FADR275Wp [Eremothecium gossypii FDAG1]